jgi:hypothetical protein
MQSISITIPTLTVGHIFSIIKPQHNQHHGKSRLQQPRRCFQSF